ncbi:MAG: lytic transglycosylase domain-containing protein [Sphingomicrobium sp.]
MIAKLLFLAGMLGFPASARAQVIEIDSAGEARTFDGPTMFTDDEATPIDPVRRSSAVSADPAHLIAEAARIHGLEPGLLQALAWQESRGRMSAVSPKGALGIMQLMPGTAAELGVRPGDLGDNIRGGALYLRRQLDRFGSVPLALAAYNAGPGAVLHYGGIPPYRETRDYVATILQRWRPMASAVLPNAIITEVPK